LECPVSAIDYVGVQYQIAAEKCTGCGLCARLCPISAISDNAAPVVQAKKHKIRVLNCDIAVLGAGGAGLVAAARAADAGKKVVVLEAAKKTGGNTILAHGAMFAGSKVMESMGIDSSPDFRIRMLMQRSEWSLDLDKVKENVPQTGEFFDWLCGLDSVKEVFSDAFKPVERQGRKMLDFPKRMYHNLKCRDQAIGPGWVGTFVVEHMLKKLEKQGVPILTEHRAKRLIIDDTGRVNGVIAEDAGGKTQINCKAVIVATGGFLRNDEMVARIYPDYFDENGKARYHKFSIPTNRGDGIKMVAKIGGKIDYDNAEINVGGPAHHPFGYCAYRLMMDPQVVYINLNGRRWIDETAWLNDGRYYLVKQPGCISYAVVDSQMMESIMQKLIANPPDGNDGWILRDYRAEMESEIALGLPIKRADTLDDLAKKIGVAPSVFLSEINKYNAFCEKKHDDDFLKPPQHLTPILKAPFYAVYGMGFSEGTWGGIVTDGDMRVINTRGNIIPGLYAIGDGCNCHPRKSSISGSLTGGLGGAFASGFKIGRLAAEAL